ncbi:MAG: hypothetical protein HOH69_11775 [Gammaproteobacteria bacterium]|nr:hypothetical protein [Gammaproteobacteria bacterium]
MEGLKGNTVLLLAPKFFDHEIEIKKELKNLDAKVFILMKGLKLFSY